MHEYSVTKSLVDLCNQEAEKNNMAMVRLIKIRLGKFTGFSPDAINFYFGYLKENTRCRNAQLEFYEIPIKIRCRDCGYEDNIDEPIFICPECGKSDIEVITGREFYVESLEGE
ncbi:MAG: hydrogenase maturation nickel metallochaperone HypA/HybF [bacterium]